MFYRPVSVNALVVSSIEQISFTMYAILLFDNDESETGMIRSALESDGFEVIHSSNGEMVEMTRKENPLLIIINDYQEKLENLKEIRNNSQLAFTPIICLAETDYKEHEAEGFSMGVNDFVYKPLDPQKLKFSVNRILNGVMINED